MSDKSNDTILIAVGGAALLGAIGLAVLQQSTISALKQPVYGPETGNSYEPTPVVITTPETRAWADAPSQSAGERWLYDVFTPPKIYYNTQTRQFTVVPPELVSAPLITDTPTDVAVPVGGSFGAELVSVSQPLFRLQLTGFVGEGASARGTFENQVTKRVQLGATGKTFEDLNLVVTEFVVERKRVSSEGGTPLVKTVARATVKDTLTGALTELTAAERTPGGIAEATLRFFDGSIRAVQVGTSVTLDGATYTVERLGLNPPMAVVTKTQTEMAADTQTLLIPPPPAPAAATDAATEGATPAPGAFF